MTRVKDKTRPIRVFVVLIALGITFWSVSASLEHLSAQDQKAFGTMYSSKQMADGKQWTTRNLDVNSVPSYCYEDAELNCRQYGRLYTWESARQVCQSLGDGWRLPTDDEWRLMAKHYCGVSEDSDDKGKVAYKALLAGGSSGFGALLGGGRSDDGQYARSSKRWREAEGIFRSVCQGVTTDDAAAETRSRLCVSSSSCRPSAP
ncbi:MAG TPA: FISUMP domain-containing protein [Terriglobales bacterium]|nr:FISUMP domain-containing protein [Terriglobales bacterium]